MSEQIDPILNQDENINHNPECGSISPCLLVKLLERLSKARDKLVDRNLKNKLINTNLTSNRTKNIRFIDIDTENVFNMLNNEKISMGFNPTCNAVDGTSLKKTGPKKSKCPTDNQLETLLDKENLQKKLKSIYFEAQEYEEEQGVNILFLALGFVKWYENDTSDIERYAPLVLLPVDLVRDGAKDKFKLNPRDEDLFTNISLKLWLKEQNSIELPDLPEDEPWLINTYFDHVRLAIANEQRWDVLANESVLGFFSFNKFLLWRDLDPENWPNEKSLLNHPIVQQLLMPPAGNNEPDAPLIPADHTIDDYFTPQELVYVVDADSSQTEAIQSVMSGKNIVIQGPPGTGKSQTITNIIAAAVAKGKKVLFVAEKMAALNVVHERLSKAGLEVICLELHSRKATKSAVLKQIRDSIELPTQLQVPSRAFHTLTQSQNFLNNHAKRVNELKGPWGLSPFEVMGEIAKTFRLGLNLYNFSIPNSVDYTKIKLEDLSKRLLELSERLSKSGVPINHPWRLSNSGALTPMDIDRLDYNLNDLKTLCVRHKELLLETSSAISVPVNTLELFTINDFEWLYETSKKVKLAPCVANSTLTSEILIANSCELQALAHKIQEFNNNVKNINDRFIDGWDRFDISDLRRKLAGAGGSVLSIFNKTYRAAIRNLKGLLRNELPKGFKNRLLLIDQALDSKRIKIEINNTNSDITTELGALWNAENSDTQTLLSLTHWYNIFEGANEQQSSIIIKLVENANTVELAIASCSSFKCINKKISEICNTTKIDFDIDHTLPFFELDKMVTAWCDNLHRFNEWPSVRNHLSELEPEIGKVCHDKIFTGEIQPDHINPIIRICILERIWQSMVANDRELSEIDAIKLDRELERFRSSDKKRLKTATKEVLAAYSKNCPSSSNGEIAIIQREMAKKRNNYPVRKLLEKAGRAIHELKPVFMMSPISIAQFIAPGSMTFDLILIDEASQVRPEDAIGAIARARQVVVVGDTKQLPPTNFFNRMTDESCDEDLPDEDESSFFKDVESILSLCDGVFQNKAMLRWHYRSQHPNLIAVSNKNFYENKLLLPPSVLRSSYSEGLGVSFIKSPQNGYKRGGPDAGRNILEADLIAREVIAFAKMYPNKSLGVAAFSVAQRDAIRDLIDEHRRNNPDIEPFFADNKNDHFFVKNLESIQGDERDVIFISVGYGRSEDGRLTQAFGPLSANGGERRLNVLISRAKERCTVFSSITAEDVKTSPGKLGVNAFREFLQFAEKGYFDVPIDTDKGFDSDFEESVAIFLTKNGYKVQPQVGMSGFFIDIGVIDPNNENKFYCGIECDGATYHSSRSARDRDRLRQEILESRGWKIYRIWSTDWFHRRHDQEAKLLDYLADLGR